MLTVHCTKCHHEWQQAGDTPQNCDWCDSSESYVLGEEEWLTADQIADILQKMRKEVEKIGR